MEEEYIELPRVRDAKIHYYNTSDKEIYSESIFGDDDLMPASFMINRHYANYIKEHFEV